MKFNKKTVERVKDNWLYKYYPSKFDGCNTDSEICIEFAALSRETGNETGLGFDIAMQVVNQLIVK